MMDIIYIRELKVDALIGVYDWERLVRQSLLLNIEMGVDISAAAATDNIVDALDYSAVAARITSTIANSHFKLIETLAEQCASIILDEFQAKWLRLSLSKPGAVANAKDVGVIIERGEKPHG
jgi:7,8-dihydroneopterin aldolase/epimerase/oxygenase